MWWLDLLTTAAPYFGYGVVGTWVTLANSRYRYAKNDSEKLAQQAWVNHTMENNPHRVPFASYSYLENRQRAIDRWDEKYKEPFKQEFLEKLPRTVARQALITGALWPGFIAVWLVVHAKRDLATAPAKHSSGVPQVCHIKLLPTNNGHHYAGASLNLFFLDHLFVEQPVGADYNLP